ncbi:hypothetical protein QPK13_10435 [Photorhabdus tasmaniensis]
MSFQLIIKVEHRVNQDIRYRYRLIVARFGTVVNWHILAGDKRPISVALLLGLISLPT